MTVSALAHVCTMFWCILIQRSQGCESPFIYLSSSYSTKLCSSNKLFYSISEGYLSWNLSAALLFVLVWFVFFLVLGTHYSCIQHIPIKHIFVFMEKFLLRVKVLYNSLVLQHEQVIILTGIESELYWRKEFFH